MYRGVRIGEASHPGRVVANSESGSEPEATLLDALEQDLVCSPTVASPHHRRRRAQ